VIDMVRRFPDGACPLASRLHAVSHPSTAHGGDTLFQIGALITPVLAQPAVGDLLAGLAVHGVPSFAQGVDEARLVPWQRTVHSTALRDNVTEVSALIAAKDVHHALAVLADHLDACEPDARIVQVHIGRGYTGLPVAFPTGDPR
jgi:hypothetical protein